MQVNTASLLEFPGQPLEGGAYPLVQHGGAEHGGDVADFLNGLVDQGHQATDPFREKGGLGGEFQPQGGKAHTQGGELLA